MAYVSALVLDRRGELALLSPLLHSCRRVSSATVSIPPVPRASYKRYVPDSAVNNEQKGLGHQFDGIA